MGTLRIACIGASGTGKTTVVRGVAEALGLEVNPVGSRSTAALMGFESPFNVDLACSEAYEGALARGFTVVDAATEAMAYWRMSKARSCRGLFQRRLQADKIAWELNRDQFITDRSTIDDLTYTAMHDPRAIDQEFVDRAYEHTRRYDLILIFRMSEFYHTAGDGARLGNPVVDRLYEQFAMALLRDAAPGALTNRVHGGVPSERIAEALERVAQLPGRM